MRKLFKGGNYSRAETIRGNTVISGQNLEIPTILGLDSHQDRELKPLVRPVSVRHFLVYNFAVSFEINNRSAQHQNNFLRSHLISFCEDIFEHGKYEQLYLIYCF